MEYEVKKIATINGAAVAPGGKPIKLKAHIAKLYVDAGVIVEVAPSQGAQMKKNKKEKEQDASSF